MTGVTRTDILNAIAPCAFCCYTCSAMKDGVIENSAKQLSRYLEGYYEFSKTNRFPRKYKSKIKSLTEELEHLSSRPCNGCRNGANEKCCIPDCFILECAGKHNVDFCGECSEFPCARAQEFLKGVTLTEWKNNNERIKEFGAEDYYTYAVSRSHYQFYK